MSWGDLLSSILGSLPFMIMWVILMMQNKQIQRHKGQLTHLLIVNEKLVEAIKEIARKTKCG